MRLFGKVAEFSAAFALFVLVVMTIGAVFMRYFIGQPLQWTEEMSGMLMIWVVMLGGVVAERDRAHLTIPFLMEMLPGKLRRVIAVLVARSLHRTAAVYGLAGLPTSRNGASLK
ncbi:putative tripartite ATP-independent periplasmic transporter (dctQ-like) [Escherichia coli]|uniref:TRAP transporter small permease protein n=1 Tax=Escherichia coli TaxID=562 RepID=A0A377APM4_ECOLX|nr:putative tripartite ATP-independent periplasmic transporter (dctQ-like) [Escherichia coli]